MGEVIISQPDPFDLYVDNKSRDMLFKDAAFILIRKLLSKTQLKSLYPEHKAKITRAKSEASGEFGFSETFRQLVI